MLTKYITENSQLLEIADTNNKQNIHPKIDDENLKFLKTAIEKNSCLCRNQTIHLYDKLI